MYTPRTIKGYINMLKKVEGIRISDLKGMDKLSTRDQIMIGSISAAIGNEIEGLNRIIEDKDHDTH